MIVIKILYIVVAIVYVCHSFVVGRNNAHRLENICTEKIIANITNVRKHYFFVWKYFQLTCEFDYNNQHYNIKKGIFDKINEETLKQIELHINPNNPNDAYLKTLSERCNCKNSGIGCIIISLLFLIGLVALIFMI